MANPTTNAGANQTITDAQPLVLTGTAVKGTNEITNVVWKQVSGPDCTMRNAASWINQVFELSAGTYVFSFAAFDIYDNTGSSTTSVTVTHTTGPIFPPYQPDFYDGTHTL